ncbi:MAG: tRNA (guanosine(37)-N1)-methyltransferase TrmD [Candidatus Omnitrophica bacterium]|nr:tRNA (guanosine(37)-N1)-methyltransferase TrmD [Candidatus Omnitrophota bacterium]
MFDNVLGESMIKRARDKGRVVIKVHNLRDWTSDNHKTADDKPFGGGAGMVIKVEPVHKALEDLGHRSKIILLTPHGKKYDQKIAKRLAKEKRLVLICGHYEGVDERIRELADEEISIGDYILTCGEIPALVVIDSVARLIPGVLGHDDSIKHESFEENLLEYPQYTRPAEYERMNVPRVLLSGNHKKIEEWRKKEAIKRTRARRPDLLKIKETEKPKNGKT